MARGRIAPEASAETIAAVATAAGAGGIGVVRISGPLCKQIAQAVTGKKPQARKVHFSSFLDAQGAVLDRGLVLYFAAPHSYTGEDVLELQAHGSPVVLDLILRRALALGARLARPGEFSERAYLNGKLDLAQAEAVADLITSGSESAARAAMRSLEGDFSRAVQELFAALVRLRAWLEAALDFPEEEIDFLSAPQLRDQLAALQAGTAELLQGARRGVVLRDGLHVVIVGRPNAGKSSLLNALARSERAIVTPIAGTTRDVLRESVDLDGIGLTLVDTAGLRESQDVVEAEGIRRARAELTRADVAVLVTDDEHAETDRGLLSECSTTAMRLIVHNKIDLHGKQPTRERRDGEVHVALSAQTGAGLDLLRAELASLAGRGDGTHGAFSARRRHVDALERVAEHLQHAETHLRIARAGELAAEELRQAQHALGEITGEYSSDDLLGAIFSTFCIGK
ncbi:MAG: tRNA uridine-5-carboxymethylaminomethyl(34) synthesis GTPase MnmE [Rudaea sp.]|uniref:tRNA uridine-5-carboxymethylaminomethyl(34) synthesis GTPase MnmE n=1 Tax=unclassified Rudaea TaxID=2627037 RepID=UPI0010F4D96B|nr:MULTISPECIES: tRNA uridine-5-carboxymethylaminomethyl(34) synthesis GTPase MnmE [unclassified Rudaea]MBN8885311.1 tRNA uridine-5-carboxymethylaminomethyl(34) synthesis GTPase MnmE [Rudaea sp.]